MIINQNLTLRELLIQKVINKSNAQSYLEIGIGNGAVFSRMVCSKKVCVDPCKSDGSATSNVRPTFEMTSDEFFEQNEDTYDVVFVDGLHERDAVYRDINNSLKFLNDGGYIICHDMNPYTKESQIVPRMQGFWHGDCWKAWVKLRRSNPDLNMCVVPLHGVDFRGVPVMDSLGVIQKGSQKLLDVQGKDLTYENLDQNRQEWLNIIPEEKFLENWL